MNELKKSVFLQNNFTVLLTTPRFLEAKNRKK